MTVSDTHADTIREALKANGVFRYGEYERSNTRPALAALDELVAELSRERFRADRLTKAVRRYLRARDDHSWGPNKDWHKRHDQQKAEDALEELVSA